VSGKPRVLARAVKNMLAGSGLARAKKGAQRHVLAEGETRTLCGIDTTTRVGDGARAGRARHQPPLLRGGAQGRGEGGEGRGEGGRGVNRLHGSRPSPGAARPLELALETGDQEAEELVGETDCEHGCTVELDGTCSHGWRSAGLV
jgi:hypothetical protein